MAIQNRRGVYTDFDKTKMVEGEFAIVLDGDPEATGGQAAYISFQNGTAKRLATAEDVASDVDAATQDIQETLAQNIGDFIDDAQSTVDDLTGDVATAISNAQSAVSTMQGDVASAISDAQDAVGEIETDYNDLKADNATQLYAMNQSVNTAIANISDAAQTATEAAVYATSQADEVRRIIEEGGTVVTVFGRSGAVEAISGDYDSTMITHGQSNVSDALAAKQNTLVAGNGIKITGQLIEVDEQFEAKDPTNVYYGGLLSAQGQGVLGSANGTSFTAITTGSTFNRNFPLLYASENIATMTTDTGDELGIYMLYATADNPVASADQAQHSPVYLVGTVSGNTFTVDSTTAYTHTKPATSDGKEYLLLGWTGQDARYFVFDPTPYIDLTDIQNEIADINPRKNILPDRTDLDDVLTSGVYHLTNADGISYLNMPPYESWGLLEVYISSPANESVTKNAVQKFTFQSTNDVDWRTWIRFWTGASWTIWRCLGGRIDVSSKVNSVDECTLDNLVYYFNNSKDFGFPYSAYFHVWNRRASNQYITQFASVTNTKYPTIWTRTTSAEGWGNWHLLAGRTTKSYSYNGLQVIAEKSNRFCRIRVGGTSTGEISGSGTKTLCTLDEAFRPVVECFTYQMITASGIFAPIVVRTNGNVEIGAIKNLSGTTTTLATGSTPKAELVYMTS